MPPRKLPNVHREANAAMHTYQENSAKAAAEARNAQDIVNITVESHESDVITDTGDEMFKAVFNGCFMRPSAQEVTVEGPERDTRAEAIKDRDVFQKAWEFEGESGVQRVSERLVRKTWTRAEILGEATSFDGLLLDPQGRSGQVQDKLIPPGEGWVRFNDEMLWDPRSQVYFVQVGPQMGKYMMKTGASKEFKEVNSPHSSMEFNITVRAGGAGVVRKGTKMERTVILQELPKIARLAMKFPLSFLDSPASAFALFQGLRSSEAADWCAKNFHTRLLPALAENIHGWQMRELQVVLERVIKELDAEILKSANALSGSSALLALLIGDKVVVSGVGQVRAVFIFQDESIKNLLTGTCDCQAASELERMDEASGILHDGLVHRILDTADDAQRILRSRSCFEVLQLDVSGPMDAKQIRTAYRKLALRVHPDKRAETVDVESYNKAFARLDAAKDQVEAILDADEESCRELYKVLSADVHTREGAANLLGVDKTASTDTDHIVEEAEKAVKWQIKRLEKLEGVAPKECARSKAICNEALETLRRQISAEALPRSEALLKVGIPTSRAMGVRDLRFPSDIVKMQPESAACNIPMAGTSCRLALLVGATAALPSQRIITLSRGLAKQPKAAALKCCLEVDASAASVGAAFLSIQSRRRVGESTTPSGPAAKRQKSGGIGQVPPGTAPGSVFLRHILFRHQHLRHMDPMARREGSAKTVADAEEAALAALEELQKSLSSPTLFNKLCREKSDCQTAAQPGNMTGHFGWVGRGEQEAALEEAAFALEINEFSDLVTTSRGIHIVHRLG